VSVVSLIGSTGTRGGVLQVARWGRTHAPPAEPQAMTQHQTSRTLVKSTPELWAECSDAASLARHLGAFGEIRITKLEPETAVAWEGTAASGTVKLEPSGWGTRVILTVTEGPSSITAEPTEQITEPDDQLVEPGDQLVEPDRQIAEPDDTTPSPLEAPPTAEAEPTPVRSGLLFRLMLRLRRRAQEGPDPADRPLGEEPRDEELEPAVPPEPLIAEATVAETTTADPPVRPEGRRGEDALAAALDSLGRAHHRPYSRA
jgi:hypothetical protein